MRVQHLPVHLSMENTDAALRFEASYSYSTSPILVQSSNTTNLSSSLHEFFRLDENRDKLLIGSGNIKVQNQPSSLASKSTRKLQALWESEASFFHSFGIEESCHNVQLVKLFITTPFLVFVINASALLGAKLTKDGEYEELFADGKVHSPEFQFLLLSEDFRVDGPPPLVWIFNQLTERYQKKSTSIYGNEPHIIHTYLRVWASDSKPLSGDNNQTDRIVFKVSCRADVEIKFPSLLLKILPAAKELIEREGNRALQHSMERDVVPGLNKFRDAFIQWERRHGDK